MKNDMTYTIKNTDLALRAQKHKGQWKLKDLNKSFGNVTFCFIVNGNGKLLVAEYDDNILCDHPLHTQWNVKDLIECDIETKKVDMAKWKIIE